MFLDFVKYEHSLAFKIADLISDVRVFPTHSFPDTQRQEKPILQETHLCNTVQVTIYCHSLNREIWI